MRLLDLAPIFLQTASRVESAFSARFSRRNVQRRNRSSPYAIAKHPAHSGTFYLNKATRKTQPREPTRPFDVCSSVPVALYTTPAPHAIFHSFIHTVDKLSTLFHTNNVFADQIRWINRGLIHSTLWKGALFRDIPSFSTRVNNHRNDVYPQP